MNIPNKFPGDATAAGPRTTLVQWLRAEAIESHYLGKILMPSQNMGKLLNVSMRWGQ